MTLKFCSLASGSSGNSHYIETEKTKILIDAGLSGKRIQQALEAIEVDSYTIDAIFITHEHTDHIKGAGILSRRLKVPIYANERTWEAMDKSLGKILPEHKKVIKIGEKIMVGDLEIESFSIYHDAIDPVGYIFKKENKKITLLTDTGKVCDHIREKIKNSNLTLIESNHDKEMLINGGYPWYLKKRIMGENGHLSNEDCGNLISEVSNVKNAVYILAHLSKENNTPQSAYNTVIDILKDHGLILGSDISIEMSFRDKVSKVYAV